MTINEVTLNNNKLNTEQLEKVAGGIGGSNCPSCGSRKLEFLFRSTSTVKYLCPKCQHQFALQGGQYC